MAYTYTNSKGKVFYLHSKSVVLKGGGYNSTIYFFALSLRDGQVEQLPAGKRIVEAPSGLPLVANA